MRGLSTAVVICSIIAVLAAWHSSRTIDAADPKRQAASAPPEAPAVSVSVHGPTNWRDLWYGKPAPTPGDYIKEKDSYRAWRTRFGKALKSLDKGGHTKLAADLRRWFRRFESAEVSIVRSGTRGRRISPISPFLQLRQVARLVGPPPVPAFERFHGYKVVLPWNHAVYYYRSEAVPLGTPYLLHPNGVRDGGVPIRSRGDIHKLFIEAGVDDVTARNVLIKVSRCEGGFDAVNTWDTGYVSVGFLQFTAGRTSEGRSLVRVLERMKESEDVKSQKKTWHANEFDHYFRNRGINVRDGRLSIVDPSSCKTLEAEDAVDAIIRDKRLIAVFENAGAKSKAFQLAQIKEGYRSYYMVRNRFRIPVAEISVYDLWEADGIPPDCCLIRPVKKRRVYGTWAVRQALEECVPVERFRSGDRTSKDGRYCRVVTRLPDLTAAYGDILQTEGAKVSLIDRAVQHGVQSAADAFEECVAGLCGSEPMTLEALRLRENDLVDSLENRIIIEVERDPTDMAAGPAAE